MAAFPLVSEMIRKVEKILDWTRIPTYGIMMETQIAYEVTELSVLQCRAPEHRVELVESWEELGEDG